MGNYRRELSLVESQDDRKAQSEKVSNEEVQFLRSPHRQSLVRSLAGDAAPQQALPHHLPVSSRHVSSITSLFVSSRHVSSITSLFASRMRVLGIQGLGF